MEETPKINLETALHLEMLDSKRIEQNAEEKSYAIHWNTYKGGVRGEMAGIFLGTAVGLGIGLAAFCCGMPLLLALPLFGSFGLIIGKEAIEDIGRASASRAEGLSEKHARFLDPANANSPEQAATEKLMINGQGNHHEFPSERDKGKFFNWNSGGAGALIGSLSGALIGSVPVVATHLATEVPLYGTLVGEAAVHGAAHVAGAGILAGLGVAAAPVACALALGICGLSYGVDRSVFKTLFNDIAAIMHGNSVAKTHDIGLQDELQKGQTPESVMERRLVRQDDTHALYDDYVKKIFLGSVKSYFKGAASGTAIGALVGAVAGVVALGAVLAVGSLFLHGAVTLAVAAPLVGGFAAVGGLFGFKTFGSVGIQAGAEATTRAIDDEFELGRALRSKGIFKPSPSTEPTIEGFNAKASLGMGAVGALLGVVLTPILPVAMAGIVAPVVFGLLGASSGFGNSLLHKVIDVSNTIYNKTYYGHGQEREPEIIMPASTGKQSYDANITKAESEALRNRLEAGSGEGKDFGAIIKSQNLENTNRMLM